MEILVETRLVFSSRFKKGTSEIRCGRYAFRLIPSTNPGRSEAVLSFPSDYSRPDDGGSHPEEEANILCNCLAVLLESQVKRQGLRFNGIESPFHGGDATVLATGTEIDSSFLCTDLARLLTLDIDVARQFVRSCRAFASAIGYIPSDPTFAFFLLVVAVECLSSQPAIIKAEDLDVDSKKCERFCLFIDRNLPATLRGSDEQDSALFRELLKTTYYAHRSGFVHGGKDVSITALMADSLGSSYFKHFVEGKEVRTPGLRWFARIVRNSILGYVRSCPEAPGDPHLLAKLADERASIAVKLNKNVGRHRVVTSADVDYR